jgi:hypothetical protein
LRISLSAAHSMQDVDDLIDTLRECSIIPVKGEPQQGLAKL